jgi:hypothetical protein
MKSISDETYAVLDKLSDDMLIKIIENHVNLEEVSHLT